MASISRNAPRATSIETTTVRMVSSGSLSGCATAATSPADPGDAEADERDVPVPATTHAEQAGDEDGAADDHDVEHELVCLTEQVDEDLLAAGWLQVDDQVADGDDQRRRPGNEAGDQFADSDTKGGRETASRECSRVG